MPRDVRHAAAAALGSILMAFFVSTSTLAAAKGSAWPARLDAELQSITASPGHPLASLSVLAIRHGEIVYQRQFGHRHIDSTAPSKSLPANGDTLYRVASISKLITTLGVMRLVEAGKLRLDDDVSVALGFQLRNPSFPEVPITLRMLLNHTSSLRDDAGYYWDAAQKVHMRDVLTPEGRLFGQGAMWDRGNAPGTYFQYCNLAWGVVGTVMERATGERFDRLMKRLVLDPLQLRGGFHPADFDSEDLRNVATLYRKRATVAGREVWNPAGPWIGQVDDYVNERPVARAGADYVPGSNGTLFGPQGNCRLSAAGLARVMRMLMARGRLDGLVFLRGDSVAQMLMPSWRADARGSNGRTDFGSQRALFHGWGLGNQHFLDVSGSNRGDRLVAAGGFRGVGHLGDAWGLTAAFVLDPGAGTGLIYLIGGPGFDPATYRGTYSAFSRHEELILDALYRRAIQQQ